MDKKRCLVVNLIGGPGCGKSTTTAGLFYELKKKGYNCEMSLEFAKDKVYEESFPRSCPTSSISAAPCVRPDWAMR